MRYMFESEVSGRLARWAQRLSGYDFTIKFVKGKLNVVADFLSHLTSDTVTVHGEEILFSTMNAEDSSETGEKETRCTCPEHMDEIFSIWQNTLLEEEIDRLEQVEQETYALFDDYVTPTYGAPDMGLEPISKTTLKAATEADEEMGDLFKYLKHLKDGDNKDVKMGEGERKVSPRVRKLADSHLLIDGVLIKHDKKRPESSRVYVPRSLRMTYLALSHDLPLAGHLGAEKTLSLLRRSYYWPGMSTDVKNYCRACVPCVTSKTPIPAQKGVLTSFPLVLEPHAWLHIDHVGELPTSPLTQNKYLLTVICRATSYFDAIPVRDTTAATAAEALYRKIVCRYGTPSYVTSDQGPAFVSEVMKNLQDRLGIKWLYTPPETPQANGKVERRHRVLKATLRGYCVCRLLLFRREQLQNFVFMWTFTCLPGVWKRVETTYGFTHTRSTVASSTG